MFFNDFERVYHNQLYFDTLLSSLLAAFRKHYNCQHVLINLIEKCRQTLDSREYFGLIIMDLSKAFDCLPHRLFFCKLHKYGVSKEACQLLHSYLMNRRQRVKIACFRSKWVEMNKGVPQGSVHGPLIFNIFINDIKNNAWVTVNNDFLVTSEVICQWFSRVTKSRVKIIGKSPHEWPKKHYSR